MNRNELNDLATFAMVAEEKNFTRTAAKLGISPSGLSRAMRNLEEKLGVQLLSRTTRSVSATAAGERLLNILQPALNEIKLGLATLRSSSDKLSGSIRITTTKHAAETVIWPILPDFLATYPEIKIEVAAMDDLTDIVASQFDAGIRLGEKIEKDMIAIRVGPNIRPAIVATSKYFNSHPEPQIPKDLMEHRCINYRMASSGGLYTWKLKKKDGQVARIRADGALIVNDIDLLLSAVLADQGVAWCFEDVAMPYLETGKLIRVLEDWSEPFTGYHIYYPNRRQLAPELSAFIEFIRYKEYNINK
ncbi:LysR family transcriptional regulator [Burkholderia pseudomallei]|nr:LysR family transcriptional regulator [Burkholderia pseudomallei]